MLNVGSFSLHLKNCGFLITWEKFEIFSKKCKKICVYSSFLKSMALYSWISYNPALYIIIKNTEITNN